MNLEENKNCLRVVQVDPESDSFTTALGLTEERCAELWKLVRKAAIDQEKISGIYAQVSEQVNHANELIMVAEMVNELKNQNDPLQALGKILFRGDD